MWTSLKRAEYVIVDVETKSQHEEFKDVVTSRRIKKNRSWQPLGYVAN